MSKTEQGQAFNCRMCGGCCQGQGGIVLTRADQDRLSTFLGLSLSDFLKRYVEKQGEKISLISTRGNDCIFFRPNTGCLVHSHKPAICRAWPFFRGNLLDVLSWKMAQEVCPGINPEVGHQGFVRQGLAYLQAQGLDRKPGPAIPSALVVQDLLEGASNGE